MIRRWKLLCIIFFIGVLALFFLYRVDRQNHRDSDAPKITMEEKEIKVKVSEEEEAFLDGITAEDVQDGDVTDSLLVEKLSSFVEKGTRTATIAAFDKDNHVSKAMRTIVYTDYESPQFHLSEPLRFPVGTSLFLQNISVTDCLDGDLTDKIKILSDETVDEDRAGEYKVQFSVTNSAGDTVTIPATLELYSTSEEHGRPKIILSEYLVNIEQGDKIDLWEFVEEIQTSDGDYKRTKKGVLNNKETEEVIKEKDVKIEGTVDCDTPGVYEVMFTYTHGKDSDDTGHVRLIVVVNE